MQSETALRECYNLSYNDDIIIYKHIKHKYAGFRRRSSQTDYYLFNRDYLFNLSLCDGINITDEYSEQISFSNFKDAISENISAYVDSSSPIKGDNFTALILSSDDMDVETQLQNGISAVDLGNCTNVIKEYYKISSEENLIVLNVESKINKSNNIGKSVQVEIFDYSGRQLNLSVCNENIKVLMNLDNVEGLDIETSYEYAKQGIDVFNVNDSFFNDLCQKYDNKDGVDIIIDDRRSDVYQNITFCQDGCTYNGVDYELRAANCQCDSSYLQNNAKSEESGESTEKEKVDFKSITKSFISSLLDFNIDVIFCYNLVFDLDILKKNIGFFLMLILNLLQIICLIIFLIKRLNPIKQYMSNFYDENALNPKKNEEENTIDKNIDEVNTKIEEGNGKKKLRYLYPSYSLSNRLLSFIACPNV